MARIRWIDIAKGIGILLVVAGHSSVINACGGFVGRWINSFHMPLFFVMSGLLFDVGKAADALAYFLRKLKGLMWPYFGLSLVCALLSVVLYFGNDPGMGFLAQIKGAAILQSRISPFWFLPVLLATELAYRCMAVRLKTRWIVATCCFFAVLGSMAPVSLPYCPILLRAFLNAVPFYCVGHMARRFANNEPLGLVWLSAGGIMLAAHALIVWIFYNGRFDYSCGEFGNVGYFYFPVALLAITGLSVLCKAIDKVGLPAEVLSYIGKNSIVLLAIHGHVGLFRDSWQGVWSDAPSWAFRIAEYMLMVMLFMLFSGPLKIFAYWSRKRQIW